MTSHATYDQYSVVNQKSKSVETSPPQATTTRSPASYEELWDTFENGRTGSQENLSYRMKSLRRELGSTHNIKEYFEWVKSRRLKNREYILSSIELAIDLEKADWIEGNSAVRSLNSRLSHSVTARIEDGYGGVDLCKVYGTFELGLRIHGQPLAISRVDPEYCDAKGIAVSSELVLAILYHENVETTAKKKTMVFSPLGHIFIKSKVTKKWVLTELVLISEIREDGRAGNLYLVFPPGRPTHVSTRAYIRPGIINEEEWEELQNFQDRLTFTLAKVDDKQDSFALLKRETPGSELVTKVISTSQVKTIETGLLVTGNTGIPFALCPEDRSTQLGDAEQFIHSPRRGTTQHLTLVAA